MFSLPLRLLPTFYSSLDTFPLGWCMVVVCHLYLPFTLLNRGLRLFAAGLALRDDAASIAPARFLLTPAFRAMLACTALNPGCRARARLRLAM